MAQIHMYVGIAVIALNGLAGAWGGIAWLRREPSVWFWYALRAAQVVVVVQAVLGMVMTAGGTRPVSELHILYGLAPLLVTLVSEAMRAGAVSRETRDVPDIDALPRGEQVALARRVVLHEMAIMSVGALVILGLALRAYFVGA